MRYSFREAGEEMDPVRPVRCIRGYDSDVNKGLAEVHRWRPRDRNRKWSLRANVERHANRGTTRHKFLWYNTWLLKAPGGNSKPELGPRSRELGQQLADARYDIVALSEVFEGDHAKVIQQALESNGDVWVERGPAPEKLFRGKWIKGEALVHGNSGLATFGIDRPLIRTERKKFDERGDKQVDADAHATKGVLLTEIDLGVGTIDLYTTHLYAGGGWIWGKEPSSEDKHRVKTAQVEELAEFIRETHTPRNVAIVAGDFNIEPVDEVRTSEDRARKDLHEFLEETFGDLDLRDVWTFRGGKVGATHHLTDPPEERRVFEQCLFDTSVPLTDQYCNDYVIEKQGDRQTANTDNHRRIDRLFVEEPMDAHTFNLDITRVRRRPFWREIGDPRAFYIDGDENRPSFLSDHIGLETTLLAV